MVNNRQNALAQIHIAKQQLALDEDLYRDMLHNLTGKRSCKEMALAELYQVIKQLQNLGFKRNRTHRRDQQFSPKASGKIIDVMRAIWIKMYKEGLINNGSEAALEQWAKRASSQRNGGLGVESLSWLERDKALASAVLEDLKQWQRRAKKAKAKP